MADEPSPTKIVKTAADVPGLDLPPTFANRFNVSAGSNLMRIAIGEFVAGDPDADTVYHSAIVVPTHDAISFAKLILRLAERAHEQEASKKARPDGDR